MNTEAEIVQPEMAVALAKPIEPVKPATMTPQQARIDAVAELTKAALAKAGTLQLTPEESKALSADFADECFQPGAGGKENLIYIEHASLRDRFNSVLGLGQWAIIVRETWNEDFASGKGTKGVRVYCRAMLLVRGCYVGESVGDMDYYPSNASQNYGDAFEGAKTAAFRRCAKEFGIGLQAWRKDWCVGWWKRRFIGSRTAQDKPSVAKAPSSSSAEAPKTPVRPPSERNSPNPVEATPAQKERFLAALMPVKAAALEYAVMRTWILPNVEGLEDIPLKYVPTTQKRFQEIMDDIRQIMDGDQIPGAEADTPPIDAEFDLEESDEPWRDMIVPFGKNKGERFGALEKGDLWWWCTQWKAEPREHNGKTYQPSESDLELRAVLDEVRKQYKFTDKKTK